MRVIVSCCLMATYLSAAGLLFVAYARWRRTGTSKLNPRYLVAGIIALIGLALTVLVATLDCLAN